MPLTMPFTGARTVAAPAGRVWAALHDPQVLRAAIPGCQELVPNGGGGYAATLGVRVGRIADTYRGTFDVGDHREGAELDVAVVGRGRCGQLELTLRVRLDAESPTSTVLTYDARATVGGLVARLGRAPLTVAGTQLTSSFFRGLDRAVQARPAGGSDVALAS